MTVLIATAYSLLTLPAPVVGVGDPVINVHSPRVFTGEVYADDGSAVLE